MRSEKRNKNFRISRRLKTEARAELFNDSSVQDDWSRIVINNGGCTLSSSFSSWLVIGRGIKCGSSKLAGARREAVRCRIIDTSSGKKRKRKGAREVFKDVHSSRWRRQRERRVTPHKSAVVSVSVHRISPDSLRSRSFSNGHSF